MIQIGGHKLGAGEPPYVIAEIGSNWKTFEDAFGAIELAKAASAHAVKFQLFDFKSLYGIDRGKRSYNEAHDLPIDWLPKLKARASQLNIDFMCTMFNPLHVRTVDPMVFAHKVASSDVTNVPLLEEVARMGKPVFLSVGAATPTEIAAARGILGNVPVILMYCVSAYPAKAVDLTLIDQLKPYSQYVGYSDHTTDVIYIPYAAVKFHGAMALEKHLTTITDLTPDSPHSVGPAKFKLMVERIMGKRTGVLGPTADEMDMVLRHKRRLMVTSDVQKGEALRFDKNFGAYRSLAVDTKGMSPFAARQIEGRLAVRNLEAGEPLALSDFE